jgi:hypothetical protein
MFAVYTSATYYIKINMLAIAVKINIMRFSPGESALVPIG